MTEKRRNEVAFLVSSHCVMEGLEGIDRGDWSFPLLLCYRARNVAWAEKDAKKTASGLSEKMKTLLGKQAPTPDELLEYIYELAKAAL